MDTEIKLSEEAESLARVPLFKRLTPGELEKLAEAVDQCDYKAGDVIFNERDRGDALYVVETGSVRIWVWDEDVQPVTLAELKPGEFFGELAVLDRGERSTSATSMVDTHLHRLSSDDFQQFLMEHPDVAMSLNDLASLRQYFNLSPVTPPVVIPPVVIPPVVVPPIVPPTVTLESGNSKLDELSARRERSYK